MKVLNINVTSQHFKLIQEGEQVEFYRGIKSYWCNRFLIYRNNKRSSLWWEMNYFKKPCPLENILHGLDVSKIFKFDKYDQVEFINGYGSSKPRLIFELKGIRVGHGLKKWGGSPKTLSFILILGDKISEVNVNQ